MDAIVIPHLGASTEESEDNCAKMAVAEIRRISLKMEISHNSVNYPGHAMWESEETQTRITILHKNIPNMIGQFTTLLAQENVNIALMTNKSREAAMHIRVIDVDNDVAEDVVKGLEMIEGVLKVRVIA